jgi:hypothetical protein
MDLMLYMSLYEQAVKLKYNVDLKNVKKDENIKFKSSGAMSLEEYERRLKNGEYKRG